jgi:hypothetical protein
VLQRKSSYAHTTNLLKETFVFNEEEEEEEEGGGGCTVGPSTSPDPNYIPQRCQESHIIENKMSLMTWYVI